MNRICPPWKRKRTRKIRVCETKKDGKSYLLGVLALRVQAYESRARERGEERLISRVHLVKVPLRQTVLLDGGGILALDDLAAVWVLLFQSTLYHHRELALFLPVERTQKMRQYDSW